MSRQVYEAPRQELNLRRAETLDKVLRAGLEELRSVGHEALTVRAVAQRAGVSAATAYTYLASKNHLYAELFWRHLAAAPEVEVGPDAADDVVARLQRTTRALVERIVAEPALAAAVTPALLSADPDVARLRLRIGSQFFERFEQALARPEESADPAVLEALVLAFSGALLQAGMGLMTYDAMAERLDSVVAVIMRGNW